MLDQPVTVFELEDHTLLLTDGYHRVAAAQHAGRTVVDALTCASEPKREAVQFAIDAARAECGVPADQGTRLFGAAAVRATMPARTFDPTALALDWLRAEAVSGHRACCGTRATPGLSQSGAARDSAARGKTASAGSALLSEDSCTRNLDEVRSHISMVGVARCRLERRARSAHDLRRLALAVVAVAFCPVLAMPGVGARQPRPGSNTRLLQSCPSRQAQLTDACVAPARSWRYA